MFFADTHLASKHLLKLLSMYEDYGFIFLIDDSGEKRDSAYVTALQLISGVVRNFPISDDRPAGVISLGTSPPVNLPYNQTNTCDFLKALTRMGKHRVHKKLLLEQGFKLARDQINHKQPGRKTIYGLVYLCPPLSPGQQGFKLARDQINHKQPGRKTIMEIRSTRSRPAEKPLWRSGPQSTFPVSSRVQTLTVSVVPTFLKYPYLIVSVMSHHVPLVCITDGSSATDRKLVIKSLKKEGHVVLVVRINRNQFSQQMSLPTVAPDNRLNYVTLEDYKTFTDLALKLTGDAEPMLPGLNLTDILVSARLLPKISKNGEPKQIFKIIMWFINWLFTTCIRLLEFRAKASNGAAAWASSRYSSPMASLVLTDS
uniref:VWFA domain-containing protein n=1 Tax=Timema poppense TaxID=170557 RepID=A0A7R9CSV6_TIMPO|nr:unnamed protein product [Timema poppensis]